MALVIGISSVQASLRNVHEDFIDSSGVYATVDFTSFHIFYYTGFRKNWRGVRAIIVEDKLSTFITHRVVKAIFWPEI